MVTQTLAHETLTVEQLQAAATWARQSYEIHFDRCRSRHVRFCLACDELDIAADQAERVYREANGDR